eukprot:jgi/Bigna1/77318/fgenesh1_pg.47_\
MGTAFSKGNVILHAATPKRSSAAAIPTPTPTASVSSSSRSPEIEFSKGTGSRGALTNKIEGRVGVKTYDEYVQESIVKKLEEEAHIGSDEQLDESEEGGGKTERGRKGRSPKSRRIDSEKEEEDGEDFMRRIFKNIKSAQREAYGDEGPPSELMLAHRREDAGESAGEYLRRRRRNSLYDDDDEEEEEEEEEEEGAINHNNDLRKGSHRVRKRRKRHKNRQGHSHRRFQRISPASRGMFENLTEIEVAALEIDTLRLEGFPVDDVIRRAYLFKHTGNRTWLPRGFSNREAERDVLEAAAYMEPSLNAFRIRDYTMDSFVMSLRRYQFRQHLMNKRMLMRHRIRLRFTFHDGSDQPKEPHYAVVRLRDTVRSFLKTTFRTLLVGNTMLRNRKWDQMMESHFFYDLLMDKEKEMDKLLVSRQNSVCQAVLNSEDPLFDADVKEDMEKKIEVTEEKDLAFVVDERFFESRRGQIPYSLWEYTDNIEAAHEDFELDSDDSEKELADDDNEFNEPSFATEQEALEYIIVYYRHVNTASHFIISIAFGPDIDYFTIQSVLISFQCCGRTIQLRRASPFGEKEEEKSADVRRSA